MKDNGFHVEFNSYTKTLNCASQLKPSIKICKPHITPQLFRILTTGAAESAVAKDVLYTSYNTDTFSLSDICTLYSL